jgi:hypothetical protein
MAKSKKPSWGKKKEELAGAEHKTGKRGSTQQRHEDGQDRKKVDQQGEKSQAAGRRGFNMNTRTGRAAAAAAKKAAKEQGR